MPILSFNQAKRNDLLKMADVARERRQLRRAYDFLREALRYGENAAIFNRAATILNEMGEYEGALQVAQYALKVEPQSLPAKWETALACERLWKVDEAIRWLGELPDDGPFAGTTWQEKKINLLGLCCIKCGDLPGARQAIFRGAIQGRLPQPLAARADRLEQILHPASNPGQKPGLGLRDWVWVMSGHRLLHTRRQNDLCGTSHHIPGSNSASSFSGEHFVMAHLGFPDCGYIFHQLRLLVRREGRKYAGVYACDPQSSGVALAAAKILRLPVVDFAKLSGSKPILLCLASNHGVGAHGRAPLPLSVTPNGGELQHDLFVLAKSFEREEFHDVVPPPHHRTLLGAWSEPMGWVHRQIIGAIGECINLPWSEASIQARESMSQKTHLPYSLPLTPWSQKPDGFSVSSLKEASPVEIASWLVQACDQIGETALIPNESP